MTSDLFETYNARDYLEKVIESETRYVERITQEHNFLVKQEISGTYDECKKPENIKKNRFPDIECWDATRVHLRTPQRNSNYIHANYVNGFNYSKKFIVTQEPMDNTLEDYWTMVWQAKTKVIVMFNNLETTTESSFADDSSLIGFKQTVTNINVHEYFIETIINIENLKARQSRAVHHFKFLNQSKEDITDVSNFLDFLVVVNKRQQFIFKEALANRQPLPGPMVVYSRSGTEDAATFCVIDFCLYRIVHTGLVSVPVVTLQIRQQRRSSIKSIDKYFFINNTVVLFLSGTLLDPTVLSELRSHFNDKDVYMFLNRKK